MITGLYTAVTGMVTQEAKQDAITNNLANAETTGFKSDDINIKQFDEVFIQNYDKIVNGKNSRNIIGSLTLGSQIDGTNTNFTQGMLQSTDKPTDFALDGNGFFTVQVDNGISTEEDYTRDGEFHVNSKGFLVDSNGYNVMGTNLSTGKPEPIYVGTGQIVCDSSGNLSLNNVPKYKFAIVDFNNYGNLKKAGDNLYSGANPINSTAAVRQNTLEASNVNVTNELVNMMTVSRTFETDQKVVQAEDETLDKAVNDVGTVR